MLFYNKFSCCLGKQVFYLSICHIIKKKLQFFLMITVSQFPGKAYNANRAGL